jgi:hypothetical protein
MTRLADFRVGDRVRVIHGEYAHFGGERGEVVENNRALFVRVKLEKDGPTDQGWLFWPEDLEKVESAPCGT